MYSLILDSSTKTLYVALVNGEKVLFEKYIEGRNDHAKNIVACVNEALESQNIKSEDVDKLIVGNGPGSYTGVRMAVTVLKMMAVFMNKPLYTISTLVLMASGSKGVCKVQIDARRGNAFSCVYDTVNNKYILEEGMYPYEKLEEYEADYLIGESFKVDPLLVDKLAVKTDEPHLVVPNYLRDTEAERNLQ